MTWEADMGCGTFKLVVNLQVRLQVSGENHGPSESLSLHLQRCENTAFVSIMHMYIHAHTYLGRLCVGGLLDLPDPLLGE